MCRGRLLSPWAGLIHLGEVAVGSTSCDTGGEWTPAVDLGHGQQHQPSSSSRSSAPPGQEQVSLARGMLGRWAPRAREGGPGRRH